MISNPSERLSKILSDATDGYGKKQELCKAVGMSASQIDSYIKKQASPTLEAVQRIAKALEIEPWQLIKPEAASDNDLRMRIKSETAALLRREKELIDLAESALNVGGRPGMSELLGLVARLNDSQIQDYIRLLNAELGLKASKSKK